MRLKDGSIVPDSVVKAMRALKSDGQNLYHKFLIITLLWEYGLYDEADWLMHNRHLWIEVIAATKEISESN